MTLQEIKNLFFLYSSSSTCSERVPHFERCHSSSIFAKDQACFDIIFFFNSKRPSIKEPDNVTMSLTLTQYCELHQSMLDSSKVISNLISVSAGVNKILNSSKVSDNYINSGSN